MTTTIKDFSTEAILFEYDSIRILMNENILACTLSGGLCDAIPEKGKAYRVVIDDPDTETTTEKIGLLTSYNFLLDKDGDNPSTVSDNSLIFQIIG